MLSLSSFSISQGKRMVLGEIYGGIQGTTRLVRLSRVKGNTMNSWINIHERTGKPTVQMVEYINQVNADMKLILYDHCSYQEISLQTVWKIDPNDYWLAQRTKSKLLQLNNLNRQRFIFCFWIDKSSKDFLLSQQRNLTI